MLFLLWRALICIFCNCSKRVAAGWSSERSRETIEADNFTLNSSGPTGEVRWSPLSSPSLQEDRVLGFSMVNCDKLISRFYLQVLLFRGFNYIICLLVVPWFLKSLGSGWLFLPAVGATFSHQFNASFAACLSLFSFQATIVRLRGVPRYY